MSASLAVRVNGHTWDLYSARRSEQMDDPSSYLLRWKMIQDAYQQGDSIFDFRGISTTLDENDPLFELLQFKIGFGGEACELMGEWDYPVIPMLHWAFDMYMKRR
jgi:lipid II:glycine glycyltransferase (peptidoglycan interpeptide bridge formation enzyme)